MNVITRLRNFVRDDEGQDLIEYALLVALIAIAAILTVTRAGNAVKGVFTSVATSFEAAV